MARLRFLQSQCDAIVRVRALPLLLSLAWILSCSTGASPVEIPCADVTSTSGDRDRTVLVASDGAVMSGCELVNISLIVLVLVDPTAAGGAAVPIRFRNVRGQTSNVTVRLVSAQSATLTQAPAAGASRTSVGVIVENCTLMGATDAFVVDVHNATALGDVNLTLRDSILLGVTRGAVSVYRSALAVSGEVRLQAILQQCQCGYQLNGRRLKLLGHQ
jgi:hypothetical protein